MQWTKYTLKESRTTVKISQLASAESLEAHLKTVQNRLKGTSPISITALPALDKLFGEAQNVVLKEEYNKVVTALDSTTELNKKLTDIIQSSIQIID